MAIEKKEVKATPVKATAKPAAEAKESAVDTEVKEVKKTTEKAEETQKTAETKKETMKKEAPAKKTAKKAPAKKGEAKTEKIEEIYLQFHGQEIFTKEILERAKQAYVSEGHRESSIKSIRLYIKPEENMAYYVINEKIAGGVTL